MKQISSGFTEALRNIRQLDAIVTYQSESKTFILTTENAHEIQTELGDFLGTELGDVVINSNSITRLNPLFKTQLFKTMCGSVEIDCKADVPINTWVNVKIGVMVDDVFEYMDFGDYYIIESKYNADTQTYTLSAYDKMIESMIPYDLNIPYPTTIEGLLIAIYGRLGWDYEITSFVNQDKVLTNDLFSNQDLTFRDVLDDICEVIVGNIGFDKKTAKIKYINKLESSTTIPFTIPQTLNELSENTSRYITEQDLRDRNVTINKKYGPVNSILISSNEVVLNNLEDTTSIEENGKTEYNFKDNRILIYDSESYINEMFYAIKGLEYYLYDFDTVGKLCFDPLDEVIIKIGEDEYPSLILNDDIKLTTGLIETMNVDEPEQTTPEYISNSIEERKINDALISIDKANSEIVLKVDSDGKVAKVRLDGNADNGSSEFKVSADNIILEGVTTINEGFQVNLNGRMTARGGEFKNGNVECISLDGTKYHVKSILREEYVDGNWIYRGDSGFDMSPDGIDLLVAEGSGTSLLTTRYRLFDNQGNFMTPGTKNRVVKVDDKKVLLYAYETASPYFGDIGSGITDENGYCKVLIEEVFGKTIENLDYKVFIQECGNGKLYVKKYNQYFEVKGTPNIEFDWEVKAIQKGYNGVRLKEMESNK